MDQALFGASSTVQGILSLTWVEGGGGVNCIKLSCSRGRVIVDSFLRDKSFILICFLLEIRGLMESPSVSLQNQVGTQLKRQKVEFPENSALKGPVSYSFMADCEEGKQSAFDLGIWTCLCTGEPEPFMAMTGGSRSISRGCNTYSLSELADD